jgi:KaiC/GvpD/RAD55 family RecA-like ATPase
VRIVQDRDPETHADGRPHRKGQAHARAVYDCLRAALPETVEVSIVEAAEGKDAADHLGAGRPVDQLVHVWPEPPVALEVNPTEFKRAALRSALSMSEDALQRAALDAPPENPPQFRSPLRGANGFARMQGVVTVAGAPSAGKSYFAIGAAIDNALDPDEPWDVFYLSCEMGRDYVVDRALRAAASHDLSFYECLSPPSRARAADWARSTPMPERFTLVEVGIGVTMEQVIAYLAENVGERPTLVVLDSISSLVDNMSDVSGDAFGMTNLKQVQRYATAVRRMTRGHVAWIILSELNKEGRAKGRSLDHRSDLAIAMAPDPDNGRVKRITVTKSWFSETGPLGDFALQPEIARLTRVEHDA